MADAKMLVDIAGQCKSLFYGKGEVPFDKGGGCFFVLGNDVSSTFRYPGNPPSECLQQTSKDTRTFRTSFQLDQATKTSVEKLVPPEDPNLSQACLEFSKVRLRV